MGYGAKKLIEDLIPDYPQDIRDKALELFREFYFENPVIYSKLYEGAQETVIKIKESGKLTAVVTNKYENLSRRILDKLGILNYIDLVVGADTTSEKKPSPVPVFYTLEKLKVSNQNSILIGRLDFQSFCIDFLHLRPKNLLGLPKVLFVHRLSLFVLC